MALQISYDAPTGAAFPTAYARIVDLHLHYGAGYAEVRIEIHVSEAARRADRRPVAEVLPTPPLAELVALRQAGDTDPRQAAYRWIKANADLFLAAVDLLGGGNE